jgi:hypothetical protein
MTRPAAGDRPFSRNCNIAWRGREFNVDVAATSGPIRALDNQ